MTEPGTPFEDPETGKPNFKLEYVRNIGEPKLYGEIIVIPEPATGVMLLGGVLGLLFVWRRRRG